MTVYDAGFYADRKQNTSRSAMVILAIVREFIPFVSVADIGCGTGTWLAAALDLGADVAFGLEGDWVKPHMMDQPNIRFVQADLEQSFRLPQRVDLAISLEVAEHLSPERGAAFVGDLCAASDVVLFSAAIPGQGGSNHINEQWQSYWAGLFLEHGYAPMDLIRPRVWTDSGIPFWYRQNCLLYVKGAAREAIMLDVAHPEFVGRPPGAIGLRKRAALAAGIPAQMLRSVTYRLFRH